MHCSCADINPTTCGVKSVLEQGEIYLELLIGKVACNPQCGLQHYEFAAIHVKIQPLDWNLILRSW